MPVIRLETIEGAFTEEQKKQLSDGLAQVIVDTVGEAIRPNTWVIIDEKKEGNFYVGGYKLSPKVYHKMMADKEES